MDNTYRTKKTLGDRAFENAAPKVWNRLPLEFRQCQSLNIFKVLLRNKHYYYYYLLLMVFLSVTEVTLMDRALKSNTRR